MNSGERYDCIPKNGIRWILLVTAILFTQFVSTASFGQFTKLTDFGNTLGGYRPYAAPISDGTFLYGTTTQGGTSDQGTIYKLKLDGTGFTKLYDFNGDGGTNPVGSLYFDGTFLYGLATSGGVNTYYGTIYKIKPDGTGFTKLLDFDGQTKGSQPAGALISDGTYLYGTTQQGGADGVGTVFRIKPDGSSFSKLFDFDGTNNGGYPTCSLYSDGTFLYGMTNGYGQYRGTVFKIKNDGTNFSTLYQFTNSDNGLRPFGSLISDGIFLYGMTTSIGDFSRNGKLFKIMPDGTGFATVLNFNNNSPGANPRGTLVYDGTYLYGTTTDYGANSSGTIFKVKPDGSGFVKLIDNDLYVFDPEPEGTLLLIGTTLYGAKSGLFIDSFGEGYAGTVYKINIDGTGYTKLHDFEVTGNGPAGSLTLSGTTLTGTTSGGGIADYGTIFKVNTDGTGLSYLFDFTGTATGRNPAGRLIDDGTFFYGMTTQGGANDYGVAYKIHHDGSGYTKLLDFDNTGNGGYPYGSLIYDGSTFLYGMTSYGGANSGGTIFKIKTDGTGYFKLHDFTGPYTGAPKGSLISDGTFLYGMTSEGGSGDGGVIFKIKLDGTGYTVLFNLDATTGNYPNGTLIYDGTFLYGMTSSGGANGYGTILKIKTDGTGFTTMFDFDGAYSGGNPVASLLSDGTYLYGMTPSGGLGSAYGTVFRIMPDGTNFSSLFYFNDGSSPAGSLISDGTLLYGVTQAGGLSNLGIAFKLSKNPFTTIGNFTPQSGVAGTTVTITGLNFDATPANNIVTFNGSTAVVKSSSPGKLVVLVPVNASTGPISVTANGGTGVTAEAFAVSNSTTLVGDTIQTCNVQFVAATGDRDLQQTFAPSNSSEKIKISFSSFYTNGDILYVYDGPSTSSSLLATLSGSDTPADITATGPGGELTFYFSWGDGDQSDWQATISCANTAADIVIYNAVSPSGANPTFYIQNIDVLQETKNNTVYIFDRWQNQVWHGNNYDNTAVVFSGQSDGGSALPTGVYFYKIIFASGRKTQTGFISLRRQ